MKLNELKPNETAVIKSVSGEGALRQHFLDMGVIPTVEITLVKYAPMGDPVEFRIHDYELTLRLDDAKKIEVEKRTGTKKTQNPKKCNTIEHPGLGEGGRYHSK